ncbi:MAG: hypothetical protein IKS19_07610 [Clostridia bacterium]|nr:hypothetical protein [Clostridia bacterium]
MMDLNQITADLRFLAANVIELSANCSMLSISDDDKREFSLDIKCSGPLVSDDIKIGKLRLTLDIIVKQESEDTEPDTFRLVLEGAFTAPVTVSDDDFMSLLNINGGAALYSIARAKIETISSLVYIEGKILLPMVNIVQYFEEANSTEDSLSE